MSFALDSHRAFSLCDAPETGALDARHDENLLALAAEYGPSAMIWRASQSLVVPRTYRRFTEFDAVCQEFEHNGWPIIVRQTGGGIVPQGPGILNVSLAYSVHGPAMRHSEPGYLLICDVVANALAALGVKAYPSPVAASFCDGRYNLAVTHHGTAVKIAGTAQMWKRLPDSPDTHVGLVHALVLVDTDSPALTHVINAFETKVGNDRRYSVSSVVSVGEHLNRVGEAALESDFIEALKEAIRNARIPVV
jgi:Lipoate-protein ligase A